MYVDEFGVPYVPGGQLIVSNRGWCRTAGGIGGAPPSRICSHRPTTSCGSLNTSFHIWIQKRSDGSLTAKTIETQFRKQFVEAGGQEEDRRNRLASWRQPVPDDAYYQIDRAQFWSDLAAKRAVAIEDQQKRAQIRNLTTEFSVLQKNSNKIYRRYQDLQLLAFVQNNYLNVLNTATALSGVLKVAIDLGQLVCTHPNKDVRGSLIAPPTSLPDTVLLWRSETFQTQQEFRERWKPHSEVRLMNCAGATRGETWP